MTAPTNLCPLRPGLWTLETTVEDFDVRSVVVAGDHGVAVWDTLTHPRQLRGVAESVPHLPLTVVYSHGDWDHVWGTSGLSRAWVDVVAHEICLCRFEAEIPGILREKRAAAPEEFADVELIPPTRTFATKLTLDLGGVSVELSSLPGHTPDSIVGWIPEWHVLLAGDAVETPLPFLNPGSPAGAWAGSLERWADALDEFGRSTGSEGTLGEASSSEAFPPLVIPSHGPMGGTRILRDNVSYLRALTEGREVELPPKLSPFYQQTHASNRALVGRPARSPGPREP